MIITEITFYKNRRSLSYKDFLVIFSAVSPQVVVTNLSALRIYYLTNNYNNLNAMTKNSYVKPGARETEGEQDKIEIRVLNMKRGIRVDKECTRDCPNRLGDYQCTTPPGTLLIKRAQNVEGQIGLSELRLLITKNLGIFTDYKTVLKDEVLSNLYGCYGVSGGECNYTAADPLPNEQTMLNRELERIFLCKFKSLRDKILGKLRNNSNILSKERYGLLGVMPLGILLDDVNKFGDEIKESLTSLKDVLSKAFNNDVQIVAKNDGSPNTEDIPTYWIDLDFLMSLCEMTRKLKEKNIEYGLYLHFTSVIEREIFDEPLRDVLKNVIRELGNRYDWAKDCPLEFDPKQVVVGGLVNLKPELERWDTNVFLTLDPVAVFSPWEQTRGMILGDKGKEPDFKEDEVFIIHYAKPYLCAGACVHYRFMKIVAEKKGLSISEVKKVEEAELDSATRNELLEESLRSPLLAVMPGGEQSNSNGQNPAKSMPPRYEDVLPVRVKTAKGKIIVKAVGPDIAILDRYSMHKFLSAFPGMILTENEIKEMLKGLSEKIKINDEEFITVLKRMIREKMISIRLVVVGVSNNSFLNFVLT